ncbi:Aste57867_11841 [Aphanomyces stellatus]|uniref:Aste57867_11841 protein n=1 Tax=Aphanomyces stellatus TaxID=120398 RepID=A0A485KUN4_9STRA|nr:hypothetical protein As57867_011796 [Aphanomyces stellatus]VFT88696.1 Aste57867_11841 [Aphanomyces stellatus]
MCQFRNGEHVRLLARSMDGVSGLGLCDTLGHGATCVSRFPTTWTVFHTSHRGTIVLLETRSSRYLGRCHDCMPNALKSVPDQAFVGYTNWHGQPWVQWSCMDTGSGIALQSSDSRKFLAWCQGCLTIGSGMDFFAIGTVHVPDWRDDDVATWVVQRLSTNETDEVADDDRTQTTSTRAEASQQ